MKVIANNQLQRQKNTIYLIQSFMDNEPFTIFNKIKFLN